MNDLVKQYGIKAPWESIKRTTYKFFWHWYLLNRQTQNYLTRNNIPTFQTGYEEICLYPELIANKICRFLNLEFDQSMLALNAMENHVLLGNRMRNQDDKRSRIYYDNRWFFEGDWQLPALLFPNIMKYNAHQVYKNTRSGIWNQ
jgi:hypothetical protein